MLVPFCINLAKRGKLLRKAHSIRKRAAKKALQKLVGKNYKSPLDPIPAREARRPTHKEMQEYW